MECNDIRKQHAYYKQVAQLWQRDRARLDMFAINVQHYSQTHAQNFILGPPYEGIMGNISMTRFFASFKALLSTLPESFITKKLCSRVS